MPPATAAPDPGVEPVTEPGAPELTTLAVDPIATTTTCHDTVMITGTATPGADVWATGGSGPSDIRVAHPTTGAFCIDVPLQKNQINNLEVQARHVDRGHAPAVATTVTHDAACGGGGGSEPVAPVEAEEVNVAQGASVESSKDTHANPQQNLTDGQLDTWASWRGGSKWNPWAAYNGWVKVDLGKTTYVDKVVIHWRDAEGTGDDYAKEYLMLYVPADGFGEPKPNQWLSAPKGDVNEGDGGTDEFHFNGEAVRSVALWLQHNGDSGWEETFAIAEIEVIQKDEQPTTTVLGGSHTCDATTAN